MIGRITGNQLLATSQQQLGASRAGLARLQEQSASGRALNRPSDDPVATAAALQVRAEQRAAAQYATNIDDGLAWLGTVDTALTAAENRLRSAIDLTIQAGNGAMTATGREALAGQLEGLKADLLAQANTSYLGRSVFAGNADAGVAFDATYAHTGAVGSTVQRRVGAGETIAVDANGAAAFGTGPASVFASLDGVVAALRSGDTAAVTAGIDTLRSHLGAMTAEHAAVGARYARLEQAKVTNADTAFALETRRSGLEDVDTAQVLVDLKSQELSYQTALAVTARVLQPTLMSFLA